MFSTLNHLRARLSAIALVMPFVMPFLIAIVATLYAAAGQAQYADAIDIPYQKYTLDNGLTLLVHEDRKAPIVTVNIWYHVGSKDERPGITGFAHLFEHLMFNGSENYNDEWFLPLQNAGGTDLNGTTWFDRTNYFQNVPTPALDMVLWMESDRMGHFINAVTQERLDEQRDVVKNEKRQGDNRPYGKAQYLQLAGMFPEGHPYSWSTIGSMEDLNAASLDDVREWFKTYYGAANATLVIAGDISPELALEKVQHYFGDIDPGPPQSKRERWIAKRNETTRDVMYDNVPQARLTRAWNTPPFGDEQHIALQVAASILAQGKSSRLYQRLVYEEQLASSVSAAQQGFEIAGIFEIEAYLKPGADMAKVEAIIDEELNRFIAKGPTKKELQRVKSVIFAEQTRALEKIGGFSGKAQTLARYQTYLGDPDAFKRDLQLMESISRSQIKQAAEQWLSSGDYNLAVLPMPPYVAAREGADRSALPSPGAAPQLQLPAIEEFTLANGLRVLLTTRGAVPVTEMTMLFDGGYSADSKDKLGLASITAAMLAEGTASRTALDIASEAEFLGANIYSDASLDISSVSMSALNVNLDDSLDLFVDLINGPIFPQAELDRVKSNWLDQIAQEETSPFALALRRLPPLLYGDSHRYGIPFTGSGFNETVTALEQQDLMAFHQQVYHAANATLVVVGDIDRQSLQPLLEKHLGSWSKDVENKKQRASQTQQAEIAAPASSTIYLIDKPGSPQSLILGGALVEPTGDQDSYKLNMASKILGGSFTSRINMNLREDKGWAYGARTMIADAREKRPMLYYAPVQTDKTTQSVQELIREAQQFGNTAPPTDEELQRFKSSFIRSLPGKYETNGAVLGAMSSIVEFDRPLDYIARNQQQVEALTVQDLLPVIESSISPDQTIWLIVGDLSQIEEPLREANIAPVVVLEK